MDDETLHADLAKRYERFASIEAEDRSPLYAAWARGVASDTAVRERIAALPAVRPQP